MMNRKPRQITDIPSVALACIWAECGDPAATERSVAAVLGVCVGMVSTQAEFLPLKARVVERFGPVVAERVVALGLEIHDRISENLVGDE